MPLIFTPFRFFFFFDAFRRYLIISRHYFAILIISLSFHFRHYCSPAIIILFHYYFRRCLPLFFSLFSPLFRAAAFDYAIFIVSISLAYDSLSP
jgi:hypothetical protein